MPPKARVIPRRAIARGTRRRRASLSRETRRGYVARAASRSPRRRDPRSSDDPSESAIFRALLGLQVAAVPDDREPHRAADHRVPDEEDRRPRRRTGGTVPGGLRDVHVGAAAR